ncbi:MAG: hypothetical protein KatS3mg082_2979 [Nitrospiraceae bacterium]|nr:MAG: hypothetical protein KatS3mg082_2950 [Nitrospiraceae bacterium]GIW56575.1 MAG: hypothetical protein KatS3mg082_2979 [Nitrospiraceae bacterium]
MGITIGDALTVLAIVIGTAVSAWAMTVVCALVFTKRTEIAQGALRQSALKAFLYGLLGGGALIILSIILSSLPLPMAKLAGLMGFTITVLLAAIGGAGLSRLIANRVMRHDPDVSAYSALTRASGLIVAAAAFPVVGWFVIGPILLVLALGAGVLSVVQRVGSPEASAAEARGA